VHNANNLTALNNVFGDSRKLLYTRTFKTDTSSNTGTELYYRSSSCAVVVVIVVIIIIMNFYSTGLWIVFHEYGNIRLICSTNALR